MATLAVALTPSSNTITVAGGVLTKGCIVAADSEYIEVLVVLTETQGTIRRGVNGTPAAAHDAGITIDITSQGEVLTGPMDPPAFARQSYVLQAQGPLSYPKYGPGGGVGGSFSAGMSGGNTAGTTGLVGGQLVLAGGSNITLSQSVNGQSATISIHGGGGTAAGGVAISASGSSASSGTVVFSNSNGLAFGMSGATVTGSYTVPSTAGLISAVNLSAGSTSNNLTAFVFSNSNGLAFGLDGSTVTGSYTVPSVPAQTNQTLGLYASSNTTVSSSTTVDARSLSVRGMGVASVGYSAGELVISVPSAATAGDGVNIIAAGTQTANTTGTVVFSNSNGLAFGMSNNSVVTGSYTVPTVTNSSWTVSDSATSATVGRLAFTAANGLTLTLSTSNNGNHTVVGSYTVPTVTNSSWTVSDSATSATVGRLAFTAANGMTLSLSTSNNGNHTVIGSYTVPVVTNSSITLSDTATSVTLGRLAFTAANGLTLTLSTSNNGNHTLFGSYTVPNVPAATSWTVSDSATSATVGRLAFTAANGLTLTLSTSNNGNHTVFGSYTVPTVTNSSMTVSDAATSGTLARLAFTNLNGVTLSLSTGAGGSHTIVGSHNALTSQSNQAFSAAGGASNFQTLSIADRLGVSFTNTNGSLAIASVNLSMFAVSNTTQNTSGTANHSAISFGGAGIASVGVTGGSVIISVPAGGGVGDGGVFAGVSTGGNTAGSTGTVSTGNFVLVGSGALTLSQSTGAAGSAATVTFSVPQTSSLVGVTPVTISTNGSTISVSLQELSIWRQLGIVSTLGTAQGNSLVSFQPFVIDWPVAMSQIMVPASVAITTAANASSAYIDVSASVVLYTRNASTLNSILSFHNGGVTQSWSSNVTGPVTGANAFTVTASAATTLTPGEYWMAVHMSTNNTATGGANTTALANTVSMILSASIATAGNLIRVFRAATAASQGAYGGMGVLSTGATRASVGLSDIVATGTRAGLAPVAFELRNVSWW